jgi:hypothetical protein
MNFLLRFTPDASHAHGKSSEDGRFFYFVNFGQDWPHRKGFRLIGETTPDRNKARRFESHEAAIAALKIADDPPGWLVDEVNE